MKRIRFVTVSLILLLTSLATITFSAPTDSRITAVTVYSDRAIVTRTQSVDLAAGEHSILFDNLPAALTDESLQASGKGVNGATILDVKTQNIFVETNVNERVKVLDDQLKAVQKQRRVLDDRVKILEEQRGFILRMLQASTAPAGTAATNRPNLDEWKGLAAFSDESLGKIATELQSIDAQKEDLQAKESVVNRQMTEVRVARAKQSKTVTIRVALIAPGKLDVAVRYAIPNASWTPVYDARMRSADRSVELSYFGNVRNGTGEDWNNVALTLSTARPSVGGAPPDLKPWIADVFRPGGVGPYLPLVGNNVLDGIRILPGASDAEMGRGNAQATFNSSVEVSREALRRSATPPPPPPVAAAALQTAAVETSVSSATFKIPVAVSIPGNNVSQKVPINSSRFGATLQFQSTPKLIEAAFLSAYASNTSDYPLLAGPMNTFFDDTFVATSQLKAVMPGEKFEFALGVDDGINVKRRIVNRFTEDTGFTNKSRRVTYEVVVTLTNNKQTPERVVFKEPTPISRDEKIVVKLLTPQEKELGTAANPKEITREEDGKIVWRVNLKPGEKREFSLKLSVEHPGDIAVSGLE
jgi:hypothetical protein